jgi:transcription antitermination factor NusG
MKRISKTGVIPEPVGNDTAGRKINHLDRDVFKWFAIYTRARAEKRVNLQLQELGIESYLPLKKEWRIWSDRKKKIEVPLFTSYIFAKLRCKEYYEIPELVEGFCRYVTIGGEIISVRDSEIETIRKMIRVNDMDIDVCGAECLKPGEPVQVISGHLKGRSSILNHYKGQRRVVIRLEGLGAYVSVEIGRSLLRRVAA